MEHDQFFIELTLYRTEMENGMSKNCFLVVFMIFLSEILLKTLKKRNGK